MKENTLIIREAQESDLQSLLHLYQRHLHQDDVLPDVGVVAEVWRQMIDDHRHHCLVGVFDNQLVTSCILLIVPNLTRGARPYGLVENVVTHADYRKRGFGTQILRHALALAWEQQCYKVMLMTGSKREATLRFYDNVGFQRGLKTGFLAKPD